MNRTLGRFSGEIYALYRIVFGLLFAFHGAQKVFGAFGGEAQPLFSIAGLAGVIEVVGGVLIAIGLVASWAAFVASGQMAVAYFMVHQPMGLWPAQNKGELAVLYCFAFLYIASRGAGKWSVAEATANPALE
jgi:putative oxidoreductase